MTRDETIVLRTLEMIREREKHVSALTPSDVLAGVEEFRCNICGGVVRFDGTPPVPGNWGSRS